MTQPEGPTDTPQRAAGPTPEEISARLEALLKRTHALRAQQPVGQAPSAMTWPPPRPEMDHFDIVDVPDDERLEPPAAAASAPATTQASAAAASAPASVVASAAAPDLAVSTAPVSSATDPAPAFARPDWSELRLRGVQDEPPASAGRLRLLAAVLALATVGQAGYIWHLRSGGAAPEAGRLRVDGPEGAEVRVDGRPIGPAPIEHVLEPGDYAVEVVQAAGAGRAERVTIGLGRTVVVLPLGENPAKAPSPAATALPPAAPGGRTASTNAVAGTPPAGRTASPGATAPAPAAAPTTLPPGALSAEHGAVRIESTPTGLPVTMEGRARGMTPITIGQLRPGRHDVLVGGRFRQVDVTANTVSTLRVARP